MNFIFHRFCELLEMMAAWYGIEISITALINANVEFVLAINIFVNKNNVKFSFVKT